MANINVLVGTVTGKALTAANVIAQVFESQHHVQLYLNPTIEHVTDEQTDILVIVTSSTGKGDLPASILPLYTQLQNLLPLIPAKRFAVVALGDSSYDTFCQAGATMEAIMVECQGQALRPRFNIDVLEHYRPEAIAQQWAQATLELMT
ncbi:flavodoxin domain-containing protein [Pseudomonas sp. HK3]